MIDECEYHWHCPICPRVYTISENLLQTRGDLYANRVLGYYRDAHIGEHCEDFADEMELANL